LPGVDDLNSLRELGRVAAVTPRWIGFARYCELRAGGLRKAAMTAMTVFLAEASGWPFEDRRAFSEWLCGPSAGGKSEVIPLPLLAQLIQPTLEEWFESEATNPLPAYLLGVFAVWSEEKPNRVARFEAALARDGGFEPARLALVDGILSDVDYSQHHLPEGYIGSPAGDLMLLNKAAVLLKDVADTGAKASRLAELAGYRRQAEYWRGHGCAPPGTPPRSITVYFDPDA
jgi:hypothetical protein